jgi:hypothetical protein
MCFIEKSADIACFEEEFETLLLGFQHFIVGEVDPCRTVECMEIGAAILAEHPRLTKTTAV